LIVLLASFPRSGNSYLRILLHHLRGVPIYTGLFSDDDLAFDVDAAHLTGQRSLPVELRTARRNGDWATIRSILDRLESSREIFFIKTHESWSELGRPAYRTILLVRDGRDTLVSLAWYSLNVAYTFRRVRAVLKHDFSWSPLFFRRIARLACHASRCEAARALGRERPLFLQALRSTIDSRRWSDFHANWLECVQPKAALVRFEDLVKAPEETLDHVLNEVEVPLSPAAPRNIPEFSDLQSIHPKFFRGGKSGAWQRDFPAEWLEAFWERHGAMMLRLGYAKDGAEALQ
jgi:sulfotransferase family protein